MTYSAAAGRIRPGTSGIACTSKRSCLTTSTAQTTPTLAPASGFAPKCRWCPNVVCNVFKDNVFMPTRSKLQSQFPSSSHRQQKDSAASSKFHDHSSFTIHARCFSGAQNSITVLFRLFFKIFQCALFHFYLKKQQPSFISFFH